MPFGPVDQDAAVGGQVFAANRAAAMPWGLIERSSAPTRNGPGCLVAGSSPMMKPPRKTTSATAVSARAVALRLSQLLRPAPAADHDPGEEGDPDEHELRGALGGLRAGLGEAQAEGHRVEHAPSAPGFATAGWVRRPPDPLQAERDQREQRDHRPDRERPRAQGVALTARPRRGSSTRSRRRPAAASSRPRR